MKTLLMAWRNLWRNKRRTAITLSAVVCSTAIMIMTFALMEGMLAHYVSNATNMVMGEAQIHAEGYRKDRSFYKSVEKPGAILAELKAQGLEAAPRSYGYGLVSVGQKSAGALFWGVDPVLESRTFKLAHSLASGNFLAAASRGELVLGKKLARSLDAAVGDELIVVVQAADGSLGNDLYTVAGILKTVGDAVDRTTVIMNQADFRRLFVSGGRVHEIAVNSHGRLPLAELGQRLENLAQGQEVMTWRQLVPMLSDMLNMAGSVMWIFGAIFFLAAALGVMNTMLMAAYERMRELGILKALGTSPLRIVWTMAMEAFFMSLTAAAIGALVGAAGSLWLERFGIDTSRFADTFSFAGIAFDPIWRAALSLGVVIMPALVMVAVCTLASVYPAIIAARMDPVKAIHHI